jgi:hypothetical protein
LDGGAIVGRIPGMGRVLGTVGSGMHEFMEGVGNVAGHGEVDGAGQVIPFEGKAAVEGTSPVGGDGVERLEGVDEVLGVFLTNIFYTEVVDDKGEGDGSSGVAEETGSVGGGVPMELQVCLEAVVGKDAGLG